MRRFFRFIFFLILERQIVEFASDIALDPWTGQQLSIPGKLARVSGHLICRATRIEVPER